MDFAQDDEHLLHYDDFGQLMEAGQEIVDLIQAGCKADDNKRSQASSPKYPLEDYDDSVSRNSKLLNFFIIFSFRFQSSDQILSALNRSKWTSTSTRLARRTFWIGNTTRNFKTTDTVHNYEHVVYTLPQFVAPLNLKQ